VEGRESSWDQRHREASGSGDVASVLKKNLHLLPAGGTALDLACGRGANALLLAERGFRVSAWDQSPVAIDRLRQSASEQGLQIDSEVRDVVAHPPLQERFDLIVVSFFLERVLVPALIRALRPGGVLFYQTYSKNAVSAEGPKNPLYRLDDNELLTLFRPLKVRFYREEGKIGDTAGGDRNLAMFIGEKAAPSPM
jgi:tellurite methyltransferase